MAQYGRTRATGRPDVWRLRYPSGPVNAESLAVTPHGRAYVVTKTETGRSAVYEVPAEPNPGRVQTMRRVGTLRLPAHGGLIPASLQRLATGAAISADGSLLVVRTYTDAYLWQVRNDNVAAALQHQPRHITLPLQQQGEGVGFSGHALVLDSEGKGTAIVRVPLPGRAPPSPTASPPSVSPSAPAPASTPPASPSARPQSARDQSDNATRVAVVVVVCGLLLVGGLAVGWRRRRE
jgi:hypothetical protein